MRLEAELIGSIKPLLSNRYSIFEEVGFLNRCIDMVLINGTELITVEFKINDWRKAISQIEAHLIAADYAYLCMPKKTISKELLALLKKNGIGLWQFDSKTNELIEAVKPKKSLFQWKSHKKKLFDRLSKDNI